MNSKKVIIFAVVALGSGVLGFTLLGLKTPIDLKIPSPTNNQTLTTGSVAQGSSYSVSPSLAFRQEENSHEANEHSRSGSFSEHQEYEHEHDD